MGNYPLGFYFIFIRQLGYYLLVNYMIRKLYIKILSIGKLSVRIHSVGANLDTVCPGNSDPT